MTTSSYFTPWLRRISAIETFYKKSLQEDVSDTFDGIVYVDPLEERIPTGDETAKLVGPTAESIENFVEVRVFPESDHKANEQAPWEVDSQEDHRSQIVAGYIGLIRLDHPNIKDVTNGTRWSVTKMGNMVYLNSPKLTSANILNGSAANTTKGAFANGKSLLAKYPRPNGADVEIRFKSNSTKREASKPQYKGFIEEMARELKTVGFPEAFLVVTSLTRTPSSQVLAMFDGRLFQGQTESYIAFKSWATQYSGSTGLELQAIIAEKDWSTDVQGLKTKLVAKIESQMAAGRYVSGHLVSGALDLRTNDIPWNSIQKIMEALRSLKTKGYVKSYQIENQRSNISSSTGPGPEHVHLSITTKGAE
tara:strand:+ start:4280 stop:5371 length:1092 start_codon:yes stop_codon:yes gene_type:complete